MKIQLFKNGKGLIHGDDSKRIECDTKGTLQIGSSIVEVSNSTIMPLLFNGSSGTYNASFTSAIGCVYQLERVTIKGGRIVPPSQSSIEIMELRCRLDSVEKECEELREEVINLKNIFDTNSLNFLIN